MKNLDFEIGRTLASLAHDTDTDISTVIHRIQELTGEGEVRRGRGETNGTAPKRRSPVFVVGSRVHPQYHNVVKLRKQGLTALQIAEKVALNRSTVYSMLSRAKLTKASNQHVKRGSKKHRKDKGVNKNPERTQQIRDMTAAGHSAREIAEKLGITVSGIWYHAKQHNIPLNKRPPGNPAAA